MNYTLRQRLQMSGWTSFKNLQNEEWNISDLLNQFPEGESGWLDGDAGCELDDNNNYISIYDHDDEYTEA